MTYDSEVFKGGTDVKQSVDPEVFKTPEQPAQDWQGSTNQEQKDFSFGRMVGNVPRSASNFFQGIASSLLHPVDTVKGLGLAAEGGMRNIAPDLMTSLDASNPFLKRRADASPEKAVQIADAVGQAYKNRYGSVDALKQTIEKDPVGAAADLSTVLGIGGALTPGKAGDFLSGLSSYSNPVNVIPASAKLGGYIADRALSTTTGVGPGTIQQAYQAGKNVPNTFWENFTGKADPAEVVDSAKQALLNLKQTKNAEYAANMSAVKNDRSVLDFSKIDQALQEANDMTSFKGKVVSTGANKAVQEAKTAVATWRISPPDEFHTPEGFDALKQKVQDILVDIPYSDGQARLAVGKISNAIKSTISDQAPTYSKTMADYSLAADQIREIERTLSLGQGASTDTALRKLQSLLRNNVQANYGQRVKLGQALETQGGANLMPALAGQALNSWPSRGIGRNLNTATALGSIPTAVASPEAAAAMLATLPFQSPKVVGGTAYGLGRIAGVGERAAGMVGLTPDVARAVSLFGYQGSKVLPEEDRFAPYLMGK